MTEITRIWNACLSLQAGNLINAREHLSRCKSKQNEIIEIINKFKFLNEAEINELFGVIIL